MIRMISNRGQENTMMKNVISIIIFALGFIAILYGVYKVYTVFVNQENQNAQDTLDKLTAKIESLEQGENTTFIVQGFRGSEKWKIISWDKSAPAATKPDKCYFDSCICICKDEELCRKTNFCKTFKQDRIVISKSQVSVISYAGSSSFLCLSEKTGEIIIENTLRADELKIRYSEDTGTVLCYN